MKNGQKRKPDSLFEDLLPDTWLQSMEIAEAWKGFVEMRRAIKKPLTDRAAKLIVNKAKKLDPSGRLVHLILDQSTMKNWQDIFELKELPTEPPKPKSANLQTDRYPEFVEGHRMRGAILMQAPTWELIPPHLAGLKKQFTNWLKTGKYDNQ